MTTRTSEGPDVEQEPGVSVRIEADRMVSGRGEVVTDGAVVLSEGAQLCDIDPSRVRRVVFVISGVLAGPVAIAVLLVRPTGIVGRMV